MADATGGPLTGVRVLDLTRLVAGNQLTHVLADFGAEVIKLEQAGRGDPLRDWRTDGVDIHWQQYARNKKSVTVDLREPDALELVLRLAETAQVLVENFKAGNLEKLGLGPDVLHARSPRLVIVRISGWGQTGTYASRAGFGTLIEAMTGFAAMNGFPDREPLLPPFSLADMVSGTYGAAATLMALRHVEVNGGRGQVVDLSLFEPLFAILGPYAAEYRLTGTPPPRTGNRSTTACPRNVYRTGDGKYLAISASTQVMAHRLLRLLGLERLIDDPRFATNSDRLRHVEELDALIGEKIGERTLAENLDALVPNGVTAGPVYDIGELLADPYVGTREVVVEPFEGGIPMHNVVPRMSGTPGSIHQPAPSLGQHNRELLEPLGYDVDDLAARGVI
jgi:crotonobetainyl-CoA:carnitine CoA-transferase CaiB-like acyl-CoA transferase